MPQHFNPGSGQDWASVNVGHSTVGPARPTVPKTARAIDQAKAKGLITTEKKYGAGGNKSAHSQTALTARALEEADDVGTLAKVDKSLSKAIMQARTAKKLTQKDLATAINEKPQVIGEYESGKAVPNPQIISKLERKLGVKLPRGTAKSKAPATAKKASTTSGSGGGGGARTGAGGGGSQRQGGGGGVTRGGPPKRR